MPTLISALALAGLLKITHLGIPLWHLAFFYSALVFTALLTVMPFGHATMNGLGTFLASWFYFWLLDYTDVVTNRFPHYGVLVLGMLALHGTRFWIDIRLYGIGL
jgi:hypothetical protein